MTKLWLDMVDESCLEVSAVAWTLESISNSLHRVGNQILAKELMDLSDVLKNSEKRIRDMAGQKVTEDLRVAQEGSATLLHAVLEGAIAASNGKD